MIRISITGKSGPERESMIKFLSMQDDFSIVNTGEDSSCALVSAMKNRPDIIILDFSNNGFTAFALAPAIKRHSPSTAIIMLYSADEVASDEIFVINQAFTAGIAGCFQRKDGFEEIAPAVRCVFFGGLYISKTAQNRVLRCFSVLAVNETKSDAFCCNFSKTELCIVNGITLGHTDKEIARELNISIGSLRNCINHIKQITGLSNRAQVSVYALFAGMINPGEIKKKLLKRVN